MTPKKPTTRPDRYSCPDEVFITGKGWVKVAAMTPAYRVPDILNVERLHFPDRGDYLAREIFTGN